MVNGLNPGVISVSRPPRQYSNCVVTATDFSNRSLQLFLYMKSPALFRVRFEDLPHLTSSHNKPSCCKKYTSLVLFATREFVVIPATNSINLQRNVVARQVTRQCCPFYLAFRALQLIPIAMAAKAYTQAGPATPCGWRVRGVSNDTPDTRRQSQSSPLGRDWL